MLDRRETLVISSEGHLIEILLTKGDAIGQAVSSFFSFSIARRSLGSDRAFVFFSLKVVSGIGILSFLVVATFLSYLLVRNFFSLCFFPSSFSLAPWRRPFPPLSTLAVDVSPSLSSSPISSRLTRFLRLYLHAVPSRLHRTENEKEGLEREIDPTLPFKRQRVLSLSPPNSRP